MTSPLTTYDPTPLLRYLSSDKMVMSKAEIATKLGYSQRQLQRWIRGESLPPQHIVNEFQKILKFSNSEFTSGAFTFIDLFAGIGGIRTAFESIGGECVFTSEWDNYAQKTYLTNFPRTHEIFGDITQIDSSDIPDHDVLLGGFPCQPFSIAGVSKKNSLGRQHGFSDETQGTLFFDVARIIDEKRPKAFLLENVKNLQSHDKGRTFEVIYNTLKKDLGYQVFYKIIGGSHFVPQQRERIIIIGFREESNFDWDMLHLPAKGTIKLGSILHKSNRENYLPWDGDKYYDYKNNCVHAKYTLTDNLWSYLQNYKKKHQDAGNGFGFGLVHSDSVTRTLSARYYKDGSEILLHQGDKKNPRRLTPRECARLMGLPDTFQIPVSDTRAYKQFGNSVVMPVIRAVAQVMQPIIYQSVYEADKSQRFLA